MADHAEVPAKAHYRPSTGSGQQCSTCRAFAAGVCTMFPGEPAVSPSYVCDDWAAPEPVHPPARVGADHHNAVLEAAMARVDELEPKLVAVLEPILRRAGEQAARNFSRFATDHLTASGPLTGVQPTSTMICVRPRPVEADAIADPDGAPASDLHCTLAYLGEVEGDLSHVLEALKPVAANHGPLAGVVGGYGEFRPPGCGILLPDVPGLVELRVAVTDALVAAGIDYGREHGFEAHLTVNSDPSSWAGNVPGSYAADDLGGASEAAPRRGAEGRRLPDLRAESLAGEPRLGEGERRDDLRAPDRLDVSAGSPLCDGASPPPLRERPLPERGAHAAGDELGTRSHSQPAEGDVFSSWHPVRFTRRSGMGRLPGLRERSDAAVQSAEEGGAYPASACGLPLHFDALVIVRGDEEQHALPLVGPKALTAAGGFADWTPPAVGELVDADELVALFRGKTDPIRLALIQEVLGAAFGTPGVTEAEAIAYYHSPSAFELNEALRSGKPLTVEQQSIVNALDKAMAPSEDDMVLWRGYPDAASVFSGDIADSKFSTPGYLSTSETKETAEQFAGGIAGPGDTPIILRIDVPKGTPMLRVPAGDYGDQQEWLLPRDIQLSVGDVTSYDDPFGERALRAKAKATTKGVLSSSHAGVAQGAGLSFDVANPLIDGLIAKTGEHIKSIVDTTRANVMRVVGASYQEGLSIPDTAKAIRAVMTEAAPKRAIMIARTEMTSAVNGASLAAAKLIGDTLDAKMTKTWLTAPGAQYPRHEEYDGLDGQTVPVDGTFTVGSDQLQYPGDPDGSPEETIQCRCALVYSDGTEVEAE